MEQKKGAALVTGGSRGIGLAIAKQLGLDGFSVGVLATGPQERYPEAVRQLQQAGVDFHWFQGNIGNHDDRARIVQEAVAAFGEIRVLVNNAGVAPSTRADLLEMTEESYDRVMDINAKGTLFFTQLIARHMVGLPLAGRAVPLTHVNVSPCSAGVVSPEGGG